MHACVDALVQYACTSMHLNMRIICTCMCTAEVLACLCTYGVYKNVRQLPRSKYRYGTTRREHRHEKQHSARKQKDAAAGTAAALELLLFTRLDSNASTHTRINETAKRRSETESAENLASGSRTAPSHSNDNRALNRYGLSSQRNDVLFICIYIYIYI